MLRHPLPASCAQGQCRHPRYSLSSCKAQAWAQLPLLESKKECRQIADLSLPTMMLGYKA